MWMKTHFFFCYSTFFVFWMQINSYITFPLFDLAQAVIYNSKYFSGFTFWQAFFMDVRPLASYATL